MNFGEAIKSGFGNYATFRGRAPRSEYWYWTLFSVLVTLGASILDGGLFPYSASGVLESLTTLVLFLPSLAVAVRRLHDLDRTGWWILIGFTVIGLIVLIIWDCLRGTPGANRYGADPLGGVAA
jgi:uncharacterized membrane protein YhaH (DUF805 family)